MPVRNMTGKQRNKEDNEIIYRKREERAKREAYRKERKIETYLADDENFPSFSIQLEKLGLQLRDIPGDGNCLFRALCDQLEGHCRNHYIHRQDVGRYMLAHRSYFEPFIEDDIPFERHVMHLKNLGVYAGNDAIVAFARLHQVNIIIHQLNAKHLMITGSSNINSRQLHISYHNGDHYSSVRRLNDNTATPANVFIQEQGEDFGITTSRSEKKSDSIGYVRATRGCEAIEQEVIAATKCSDMNLLRETLNDCDYVADAAIAHLMQMMELKDQEVEDVTTVSPDQAQGEEILSAEKNVGANRVYGVSSSSKSQHVYFREGSLGGSSGYGSMNSNQGGARPRLLNIHPVSQDKCNSMVLQDASLSRGLSSRKQKEVKRQEKKKRAEERHRQRVLAANKPQAQTSTSAQAGVIYQSSQSFTFI